MLVVVCGPAGVGKTTVATSLRDRLAEQDHEFRLLHSDDFSRNTYEQLYDRVTNSDEDCIVDGTFYKESFQRRFADLDPVVVYLQASVDTCLARNARRDDPIPEKAVHVVHAEFHDPDADVLVDTEDRTPSEVVEAVLDELDTLLS